ncbi:MAG: FkbM family methyltransferase [Leptolyngbya sp. SIO1E4]|nr:FkbM family methyltransferase [Leptolyngbya sp. SIO1E4]
MLPFSFKLFLAKKDRRLRFLLPPDKAFICEHYLGNLRVNINTIYPIEVEMLTGAYDPKTSAIIRRFVSVNDVVIDVGANVGALTLLMATVANQGKVIAIEPGPPICSRLRNNLKLNPDIQKTVDVYQIGLSDRAGELLWQEDPNVVGNAGLLHHGGEPVKVDTLDNVVKNSGIERLDFIKIDVEGMEYEVIKGGLASITQYRPFIYYETLEPFRAIRGFDLYGQIYAVLQEMGYQHFCVLANGEIESVSNLQVLRSPNTLAIPKEKVDRVV